VGTTLKSQNPHKHKVCEGF